MPENFWELVEERAPDTPGKDRSGYITSLVQEDLRLAGLLSPHAAEEDAELFADIRAALKQNREKAAKKIQSALTAFTRERLTK